MNEKRGHTLGINTYNINYKDPIHRAYRKSGTWASRPQVGPGTHKVGPRTQDPNYSSATQDLGPQNNQVEPRTQVPLISFTRKCSNFSATHTTMLRLVHCVEHKSTIFFQEVNHVGQSPVFKLLTFKNISIVWYLHKHFFALHFTCHSTGTFPHSYTVLFSIKMCFYETNSISYLQNT